jgi:hypothetical protein
VNLKTNLCGLGIELMVCSDHLQAQRATGGRQLRNAVGCPSPNEFRYRLALNAVGQKDYRRMLAILQEEV